MPLNQQDTYIDRFTQFVAASPTSYHTAHSVAEMLAEAQFTEFMEGQPWGACTPGSRGFVRRDGAVVAWLIGTQTQSDSPARVLGCHTDSPGLMLKPAPDFSTQGWAQLGVEVYGGPLLSTWFDRDLAVAGRVVTNAGVEHLVHTGPIARIPTLAIHLDRDSGSRHSIDRQTHLQPVVGFAEGSSPAPPILEYLARNTPVQAHDIGGADLRLVDTQPPARIGSHQELFASPRLDNLSSVFAGVTALISLAERRTSHGHISLLAAFDHEELGSETRSGASGPLLKDVLDRIRVALGATLEDSIRALAHSWCLSADAGHSIHPNYHEKHDPNVQPIMGNGPILKVNAGQRYATDAHGAALWHRACRSAEVAAQVFVSHNSVPCGSTIGPLTATRLGMRTLDAGVALLSMHSVRELAHVSDLYGLARVVRAFFNET